MQAFLWVRITMGPSIKGGANKLLPLMCFLMCTCFILAEAKKTGLLLSQILLCELHGRNIGHPHSVLRITQRTYNIRRTGMRREY